MTELILAQMEDALKKRVVGQELVIHTVSNAVRLSRAGLQSPSRPLASFLFLGPTGVGKSELTKSLAEFLFADEKRALSVETSDSDNQLKLAGFN